MSILLSKYKSSLYNRFGVCFSYNSWFGAPVQTAERKRVHKFPDLHSGPCNLRTTNVKKYLRKGVYKSLDPFHPLNYYMFYYGYIFR